jgi:hypothetical protein
MYGQLEPTSDVEEESDDLSSTSGHVAEGEEEKLEQESISSNRTLYGS